MPALLRHQSALGVYHTLLDWAGRPSESLRLASPTSEVVIGEAMKPFRSSAGSRRS